MNTPPLFPETAAWADAEKALRQQLRAIARQAPVPGLRAPLAKFLASGKLLRARLYLTHARPNHPKRLPIATGIELLHAASLLHDDIIDRDLTRRNAPALWMQTGIPTALLLGDWLLAQALQHLPADKRLAALLQTMTRAELRQLAHPAAPGTPAYRQYITGKTARLFEYAARLAAPRRPSLHRAALTYGIAYQLADDLADLPMSGKKG